MIKYGDLLAGHEKGVVKFVLEPGNEVGTVCQIGDTWFYFGSNEADECIPDEYIALVGLRFAIEEVYDLLNGCGGMAEYDPDEYAYYEAVLKEAGCTGHIA